MQDPDNSMFLPGGTYQRWGTASNNLAKAGKRIAAATDVDVQYSENMPVPFLNRMTMQDVSKQAS